MYFGVRLSGTLVIPLTDDNAVSDDYRTYKRIWRGASLPARGVKERAPHEPLIERRVCYHFSWKSAST